MLRARFHILIILISISCSVIGQDIIFPKWEENPSSTILDESLKNEQIVIINDFNYNKIYINNKNELLCLTTIHYRLKILDTTSIFEFDLLGKLNYLNSEMKVKARLIKPNNVVIDIKDDSTLLNNLEPNDEFEIYIRGKNNLNNLFGFHFFSSQFFTKNFTKVFQISKNIQLRFLLYNNCPPPIQKDEKEFLYYIWTNKHLKLSKSSSSNYNPFINEPYLMFDDRINYTWEESISDFFFIRDIKKSGKLILGNFVYDFVLDYYNKNISIIENINYLINHINKNYEIKPMT